MDTSARLNLPFLLPNQAQKHVTVNESLQRLDTLVQLSVISMVLTAPPPASSEGDIYILPAGVLSGAWSGATGGQIAALQDAAWSYVTPGEGWICYDQETGQSFRFLAGVWVASTPVNGATELGINTSADPVNRLAVKSDAELLSHDDVTPGSGNARKIINKADAAATASTVFQSGFTGHAEIGLLGNNDLSFQVSQDGISQLTCAQFDADTGAATFPGGQLHQASSAFTRQILPTPGGNGVDSIYRVETLRAQNPRSYTIASIAGDTITMTIASADQMIKASYMQGVAMVRIWNLSKSPIEPAWIINSVDTSSLQMRTSTEISGWQVGDTIQFGDPTSETPNRVIAVDVSPMMISLFGTAFYQSGAIVKMAALAGSGVEAGIEISPDGLSGSFVGTRGYAAQSSPQAQFIIPNNTPSPVSSSNLLFIRELDLGGNVGISHVSINAFLV